MTDEHAKLALEHTKELTALRESNKALEKRLDENDRVTSGIHKLAENMAEMTVEMKALTRSMETYQKNMEKTVARIENNQQMQGVRIGNLEHKVMGIEPNAAAIAENLKKIEAIEKEPAAKWKSLVWLVIGAVVTAIMGLLIAKLI